MPPRPLRSNPPQQSLMPSPSELRLATPNSSMADALPDDPSSQLAPFRQSLRARPVISYHTKPATLKTSSSEAERVVMVIAFPISKTRTGPQYIYYFSSACVKKCFGAHCYQWSVLMEKV